MTSDRCRKVFPVDIAAAQRVQRTDVGRLLNVSVPVFTSEPLPESVFSRSPSPTLSTPLLPMVVPPE
ncbi:hypothetical protein E5N94_13145 [Salmonella enterica subsp. enterica serovar 1,4,[5],12:i:-]|nr:hypothetical protein E5N94_13145 [Salmonella enterica subsp. enterica serovar 1,4,[5],12:i:-]